MRRLIPFWLLLVAGCQALGSPDTQATLQAQNNLYLAEATTIALTGEANTLIIQATANAAETTVADTMSINQQLLATARAALPPTPERVVGSVAEVQLSPGPGMIQFTEIGTASAVRDSDGCAVGLQTQFSSSSARIYVTTRALNTRSGTIMAVEWMLNGQMVFQDSWTVSSDAADLCLWYFITPEDVPFSPGNWSVRILADGVPQSPEVQFVITGS